MNKIKRWLESVKYDVVFCCQMIKQQRMRDKIRDNLAEVDRVMCLSPLMIMATTGNDNISIAVITISIIIGYMACQRIK